MRGAQGAIGLMTLLTDGEEKKRRKEKRGGGRREKGAPEGSDYNSLVPSLFFSRSLFFFSRAEIMTNAEFPVVGWLKTRFSSLASF